MTPLEILLSLIFLFIAIGLTVFAVASLREGHHRAARLSGLSALLALLLLTTLWFMPTVVQRVVAILFAAGVLAFAVFLIWPVKQHIAPSPPPNQRVDERTIPFARARLIPGAPAFETYYRDHPEHLDPDNAFRQNPGLLAAGATFHDPLLSASPSASFFLTGALTHAVDGAVAAAQIDRTPEELTRFIKGLAHYHGAVEVGICELQPYHIYSNIGRGEGEWGAPITLTHRYAIAFTVEMAHEFITTAPRMTTVMESARQYVEAGKIAVILAAAIRNLGYPARAHIDGNYRVIAPLVAKDAGLGEVGRMGLLITPRLGPRVRLAVVTTDLPLVMDPATFDPTVIDFCEHCQKCVEVCPSRAIPAGPRALQSDGSLRWKIDSGQCYTYWTRIGTDCGRCMAVCPYAHPDTPLHNLIRLGVAHSANFRKAAAAMDDLFYGKKPAPHDPPAWIKEL